MAACPSCRASHRKLRGSSNSDESLQKVCAADLSPSSSSKSTEPTRLLSVDAADPRKSNQLPNSTAFGTAAAGLSKLISTELLPDTAGKKMPELNSPNSKANLSSSGQQASNIAVAPDGTAKAPTHLSGLAKAMAMLAKPDLVLQLPASFDTEKVSVASNADQVSHPEPVAEPEKAEPEPPLPPKRKEHAIPKWAMDFSDMCFIHS